MLNQVNTVVVEQHGSSFWRKTHEESGQCATVHYRGAKSKSCWRIEFNLSLGTTYPNLLNDIHLLSQLFLDRKHKSKIHRQ